MSSGVAAQPGVLLIEEYDALAVAIGSALEKFAPHHQKRVVSSFEAAEAAAHEITPELIVLDFDPPQSRAVEFLSRMKTAYPDARVLVIAAGASAELVAERGRGAALHFIEKPFELAGFGAAVQALLGSWATTPSGESRGTLRDLQVWDVVPLLCLAGGSLVLEVGSTGGRRGQVHLEGGHVTHAVTGALTGVDALEEMLRWPAPELRERQRGAEAPRTIQGPWNGILLELLRKAKAAEPARLPPTVETTESAARLKTGKKLLIIDDTEMLLIFVEDILAAAQPDLQIATAMTGTEGVRRAEAMLPDLILADYSLPDMNGDRVCERLLENAATAGIPVVMMSGHVTEMTRAAATLKNIVASIPKPFFSEQLVALVTRTLAEGPRESKQEVKAGEAAILQQPHATIGSATEPARKRSGNGQARRPIRAPAAPAQIVGPRPEAQHHPQATPVVAPIKADVSASPKVRIGVDTPSEVQPPVAPKAPPVSSPPPVAPLKADVPTSPKVRIGVVPPSEVQPPVAPKAPSVSPPSSARSWATVSPPPAATLAVPRSSPRASVGVDATAADREVILGLALEVISMQFTPTLQIGAIRARPASPIVALHLRSAALRDKINRDAGFELGPADLDLEGRLKTLRLLPTTYPLESLRFRGAMEVADVGVAANDRLLVQLTPSIGAPLRMQLRARFELATVELSPGFTLRHLVLQARAEDLRVTFDSAAGDDAGVPFRTTRILLDQLERITELLLEPSR
ncbi:MAG: response regulator [Chthoniobacterales bacterium]